MTTETDAFSPADLRALGELAQAWSRARSVVALTGAGISTSSGIPDFRSPGGRWESYQPVTYQEFRASHDSREEYWRYKGETWQVIREAEPNAAHHALRDLAEAGRLQLLVTQNVDGLHERGGFPLDRLIWIHGTDSEVECLDCGRREPREGAQRRWEGGEGVPRCDCGGFLKPATISFGQGLVMEDLRRAFAAAEACDLFVAAGTSLVVSPIHQMLPLALRGGAGIAVLTASETPFDAQATWKLSGRIETVLPALRERILSS
ncbi:MAG: Sir2 family NAD-dependent protein deacetylase [Holophagales bacterium]|nr:Sir2 family NAD-dependent protein deacetylase [Holophagales bacterium]